MPRSRTEKKRKFLTGRILKADVQQTRSGRELEEREDESFMFKAKIIQAQEKSCGESFATVLGLILRRILDRQWSNLTG